MAYSDKAFARCIVTMASVGAMSNEDSWSKNARNGVIISYSCSLNAGMDHDHVTNNIIGGDESHHLSSLSSMFETLANNVTES